MDFDFIRTYIPMYVEAAQLTMKIAIQGILLSTVVGFVCCLIRYYKVPVIQRIVGLYIELSRNTPLLIQLFFLYFGLPKLGIVLSSEACGVLGLTFLGGSYMAEAFRSGLEAIPVIQTESGLSLGLTKWQVLKYIVLPQAAVVSLPAFSANTIFLIKVKVVHFFCQLYLNTVRIVPQLVLLFLAYFGLSKSFGVNLSGEVAAILVFSFWGVAEMGDLVRGALDSIPSHQYETGLALGLNKYQVYLYVIIPQTIRRLLPQTINLVTRIIKTTSLIVLIGVVEVVKVGQQIIEASRLTVPTAALWIYGVIFLLYFLVCYPISLLAIKLEKRWEV